MSLGKIRDWLWVTRAEPSGLAALAAIAGDRLSSGGHNAQVLLPLATSIFLAFAAGFAAHDLHDTAVDGSNAPRRPVTARRLAPRTVLVVAAALFIAAVCIACTLSAAIVGGIMAIGVILTAYSKVLKPKRWLKNASMGGLALVPFLLPGMAWGGVRSCVGAGGFLVTLICIREFILDMRDADGDRANGLRTLANCVERRVAARAAFVGAVAWGALLAVWGPALIPLTQGVWCWIGAGSAVAAGLVVVAGARSYKQFTVATQLLHGAGLAVIVGVCLS